MEARRIQVVAVRQGQIVGKPTCVARPILLIGRTNYLWHRVLNLVDMSEDDERQYMRVPKEHAEAVMSKLANAGLIDGDADVRWEGDYVSFPLITNLPAKED